MCKDSLAETPKIITSYLPLALSFSIMISSGLALLYLPALSKPVADIANNRVEGYLIYSQLHILMAYVGEYQSIAILSGGLAILAIRYLGFLSLIEINENGIVDHNPITSIPLIRWTSISEVKYCYGITPFMRIIQVRQMPTSDMGSVGVVATFRFTTFSASKIDCILKAYASLHEIKYSGKMEDVS